MDGKSRPFNFMLDPDTRAALEALAEKNDRSLAAEIRRAIRAHLSNVEEVAA